MNEKVYIESRWAYNPMSGYFEYFNEGHYNPGVHRDPDLTLPRHAAFKLIDYMSKSGHISPTLDEKVRKEDLKITHRLLDIMEEKI